ncbi:(2Fe-2S)-binding protein [Segeticoccus rhizosphaerae]|uniref:(2Fe-2S)-binding protein n=1 Tax=Segeticoccus rhizosphaerae TaxID=1104777 RepID=UPI0010BFBEF5|nr:MULTISPECIES: (2Fe-2S)-binding protein [Intrasporangiaceae]
MIVCHCKVVTDRAVGESIERGACTLGQVCRDTGAGQDCGGCVFSLKRVLVEHEGKAPLQPATTAAAS